MFSNQNHLHHSLSDPSRMKIYLGADFENAVLEKVSPQVSPKNKDEKSGSMLKSLLANIRHHG